MAVPSIDTAIFEAVKARVATMPMADTFDVVWSVGEAYEPAPSQPYLRVSWFPNQNRRLFLGGADPHQRLGTLQIDVMSKLSQPVDYAIEIAGQVAAHFAADTRMVFNGVTARVTKAPELAGAIAGTTHIQVPVTVSVQTFA